MVFPLNKVLTQPKRFPSIKSVLQSLFHTKHVPSSYIKKMANDLSHQIKLSQMDSRPQRSGPSQTLIIKIQNGSRAPDHCDSPDQALKKSRRAKFPSLIRGPAGNCAPSSLLNNERSGQRGSGPAHARGVGGDGNMPSPTMGPAHFRHHRKYNGTFGRKGCALFIVLLFFLVGDSIKKASEGQDV